MENIKVVDRIIWSHDELHNTIYSLCDACILVYLQDGNLKRISCFLILFMHYMYKNMITHNYYICESFSYVNKYKQIFVEFTIKYGIHQ